MATLVLTTVGTLVGGPIGGAIGAVLGQQIDQRLLAPRRRGPRLGDLSVQTSAYGQPIPKVFGRMRIAGTVIWAADIREESRRSGGSKGAPKTTSYSYSADFAVALSSRPIIAVHRIWADGKLLRGAGGDWKSETADFRLHDARGTQAVDPLIVSAEGAGGAPAYRDLAYVVFEGLQLADFGNRIPSLTFEVEADAGPVRLSAIAAALSDEAIGGETGARLAGYAATGDSVRAGIEALTRAMPVSIVDDGERLILSDTPPAAIAIGAAEMGASPDGSRPARRATERRAAGETPDEIAIAYHEPARDWQAGLQRARRGGPGRRIETIELPAGLSAGEAKALAERRLAEAWAGRTSATLRLPWRHAGLRPGARLTLPGDATGWRIAGWTLDRMVIELKLAALSTASGLALPAASAGRGQGDPDRVHGTSVIHLLDLPALDDSGSGGARLLIAGAGPEPGWRRAEAMASLDGGASWEAIGTIPGPSVMGAALTALGGGQAALIDAGASCEVELLHDGMWLESRSDDALVAGANAAVLGDEIIQFGVAQPIAPGRFRLSRLLRGRRGTEWAMAGHGTAERFVLLDAAALLAWDPPVTAIGGTVRLSALGPGDGAVAVEASATLVGRAVRPPAPVHIGAQRLAGGEIAIGWTRRSRRGWGWLDGSDAPLGEEAEGYRVTLTAPGATARTIDTTTPAFIYSVAQQAADGATGAASIAVTVAQLGAVAPSLPPATRTLSL